METAALTIAEVAREGRISRRQVYRELKQGKLIARKSGKRTLVLAADFKAWLASLPVAKLEAARDAS